MTATSMSHATVPSLFDTHTHFDMPVYDDCRIEMARAAYTNHVEQLVLVGYEAQYFQRLWQTQQQLGQCNNVPRVHIATGLHPFYIKSHDSTHVDDLADFLQHYDCVAVGEIGLDTYTPEMKHPDIQQQQCTLFADQLALANQHQLPTLLHIRKSHAQALSIVKQVGAKYGGIAHSFSGGVQEARAFVEQGFKIGVTGQVTNPNAKNLRRTVSAVVASHGIDCLVIETDCPDMLPVSLYPTDHQQAQTQPPPINQPKNLPYVLAALSELLAVNQEKLAAQLYRNSLDALRLNE